MSYQGHRQESYEDGRDRDSGSNHENHQESSKGDHRSGQENHQEGNEDERNRGSNRHTTIVGDFNRKISDQWTQCVKKLCRKPTRAAVPSTTVEIWNLINKKSPDEACIFTLYCPRPRFASAFLRFLPFIKGERNELVGCNISNPLPGNAFEVSRETQRHTTRAPSDTPPIDFNLDTIIVTAKVLALDSNIQIEHWSKIRNLCVLIPGPSRHLTLSPETINRLSQLSLFGNTLMISLDAIITGLEAYGYFTISETDDQSKPADLRVAQNLQEKLAAQTRIRHVKVARVQQYGVKWHRYVTL
ncbi:hypothetical protein EAF04_000968 [Stromatinia cepivora]|nr:hypothetical protein EAF04_000968 [Stromatinia cepivora]